MKTSKPWITIITAGLGLMGACVVGEPGDTTLDDERADLDIAKGLCGHAAWPDAPEPEGTPEARRDARIQMIKDAAARHGIGNALVIAGVAYHESGGLNHCWSEAKWGCPGPASADCGGGPVLAAAVGDTCPEDGGVGVFQLSAGSIVQTVAAHGDEVLTVEGNIEAGLQDMLDRLWEDTTYTPAWTSHEAMLAWLDAAVPGSDAYDTWLTAMAALYHPCSGESCPDLDTIRQGYELAVRDLITVMGPDFWGSPKRSYANGSACTCYQGLYHTGQAIDPNDTYCGLRVCGGSNTVWECTAGGWQAVDGISCDYGGCSCSGGSDHHGHPIDPNVTECHFRVCGSDTQFYSCTTEGWRSTGVSCPSESGTDYSCQCANGLDHNGDPIDPAATYCGFETCGVNGGHWMCTSGGWQKLSDTCVSAPSGSGEFGYPLGDRTTSPAGGNGWSVWQVLGHYWSNYQGRHLAQDVGKVGGAYEPVYSIADGLVRVSAPNSSTYKNVVLIEHTLSNGTQVCSFYAHLDARTVSRDQWVSRGQQIATMMDQGGNTHLHYVIMDKAACDYVASLNGGGMCGYDGGGPGNGVGHADLANEPFMYTAVGTNPQNWCNISGKNFYSPSKFIDQNHF